MVGVTVSSVASGFGVAVFPDRVAVAVGDWDMGVGVAETAVSAVLTIVGDCVGGTGVVVGGNCTISSPIPDEPLGVTCKARASRSISLITS